MKKTLTIIAITLLVTISINAQSFGLNSEKYEIVEKNVVSTLNHDFASIAESGIFNLVILKNRFPNENYELFVEELDDLSFNAESSTTRYKAQLTSWYLRNAENFGLVEITDKEDTNKYFNQIADKIQSNLIAVK